MKRVVFFAVLVVSYSMDSFSQDTTFKFIFVPHARTENSSGVYVIQGIQNIDFTKYSLKMLGGDLAMSTSQDTSVMNYCDRIFDLGDVNTLWSLGNHDVESGNRALIKTYTGRDSYYSYTRDGVTFLILDTELDANSFAETYIIGAQLDTVKAVCARVTTANTRYLIVLHSRYMWMINNPYFTTTLKDSIAASSKSMDSTNWYADIYPQLKLVNAKGIPVYVFGGDKSLMNVPRYQYSTTDSIYFYAARMSNTYTDSVNNVIVVTYVKNKSITCTYVSLANINNQATISVPNAKNAIQKGQVIKVWQALGSKDINVRLQTGANENGLIQIYTINGAIYKSVALKTNTSRTVHINQAGVYIAKELCGNSITAKRFIVQ